MRLHPLANGFSAALACFGLSLLVANPIAAQQRDPQAEMIAKRNAIEKELEQIAVVDRKVMVKMRDGKRMATDIYRPKGSAKVPVIFSRTPYNFNYWDVKLGAPRDMSRALDAVKHGYAYVEMQERGHFFSEGNYDILGMPLSDGSDALKWLSTQPWSNGKVGTTGCSSTAEWQLAVAAQDDPGLTTFNVQGFGAGVGRVGPYFEQGNWYRGGAVQMLFISWIYDYGIQNQVRPLIANATQEELINASRFYDLNPQMPPVDWNKQFWHLPLKDMIRSVGGPPGIFDTKMPVASGGNMVARAPNDPAWYKGGLWHDNMKISKPGLWYMSWFDVSVSPNLAAYNEVRRTAPKAIADQQYAVIAPALHCAYTRASEHTMIGDLDMGDARFDASALQYGWFDHYLKGEDSPVLKKQPKVMYYVMGANRWKQSETWPPVGAVTRELFFTSDGQANTLYGNGKLVASAPDADKADQYVYDPMNPVTTLGGGGCCMGSAVKFGSYDQRPQETRNDILVYDSEPFKEGVEVSGPITVSLYVSSSAKDTDFTFKVIDVYPDGTAYNITENIQRMRYRNGYDKPLAWMKPGEVTKVTFQPIDTSYYFKPGHKLRIDVSSSNFPRFDRNLNTGGNNYDEDKGVIAHNAVHHGSQYPSKVTYTVVPGTEPVADDKGTNPSN
ncbi:MULTISPECIES: CocE/NonD family hydrolase [Dyella]|uniref:CocE/NonD family hydrolase n=2 Tax=Dyella TaxID=231454 RepID=A0A4V2NKV4_9GAMM|nr:MULTISPECIES: CocE/NonD family hydrolase [Dyella]TBR36199.1 CocE/NonD family hydrolase [Dyella terrae]TCI06248.1 CocE/NonD family hydrolase [Dyella soli]